MKSAGGSAGIAARRLGAAYAHLLEDGAVAEIDVDEEFWTSGVAALPPGRLVSAFENDADWTMWERHPAGDEFVMLLSGRMRMILEEGDGTREITLGPEEFVVVPRGVWHTADVLEPGRALFITNGEGTAHRPR